MIPTLARYKQERQSTCDRLTAGSQLFDTTSGRVEAAVSGKGSAVLISHGSGGGYDMGIWLANLIDNDFRYIAPSRFGYLRSPVPSTPTPEKQADTYAALLDSLKVEKSVIIGLSAGGASALQFALRHSKRCSGLIMISAVSLPVPPLPRFLQAIYPVMLKSDLLPWLMYSISPKTVFQSNGVSKALLKKLQHNQEKMRQLDALYHTTFPSTLRLEGMITDLRLLTEFSPYPIQLITCPTLVIHAINDPIIPFKSGQFSAERIPNVEFLQMEDGGHFTCVTHSEVTVPVIQRFLEHCM